MASLEQEFTAFAVARMPQLYRTAWLLCGDHDRAEELTREALATVYAGWGRKLAEPAGFARTVLVRSWISGRRRHHKRLAEPRFHLSLAPGADLNDRLTGALAGLEELDRAVLVLSHLDDLPADDVAEILGMTTAGVELREARARALLAETVAPTGTPPRQQAIGTDLLALRRPQP